jgi:hypothetical protein
MAYRWRIPSTSDCIILGWIDWRHYGDHLRNGRIRLEDGEFHALKDAVGEGTAPDSVT